ncbi:histidine phosphatase family protein [Anditalea andensis]|uniref:Phosphoglycerate mutase n=1 Tax=Anditalea andensis TaxID=1048983 RepID=A0A074KZT4_9BACT|nr:histidine phosphatase family protein [Anditalea andensis]KEO75506.1 hypothetical protein EL17_01265 [Anditalea andensis]
MKKIFNLVLSLCLALVLTILGSCEQNEEPDPILDNAIVSEDYVEGIYVIGYSEKEYPIHIETTNPAVFSAHPSRKTFEINPTGQGNYKLPEGAYWVQYHFEDEPSNVHTLPVLITKNKPYAREAIAAVKKMKDDPAGYSLILRHGDSDIGTDKVGSSPEWFKSCDSKIARQMSQKGIDDSKKIGASLKALNIPVAATTASQYCRAIKTVQYMDFGLPVIEDARLNHENSNSKDPMFDDVEAIIKNTPTPNGIHIIVGHYNMCHETVFRDHIMPLKMGDGWIMKTGSNGQISFVGAVPLFYWDILVQK